jgi:nicotinamide riboside kinase
LCSQLAEHFAASWCPEYARAYLDEHGTQYRFENLLDIAKGQWELDKKMSAQANRYLFVDTDQYVMKVWCEYVFNQCHTWILNRIPEQQADLYLLCKPDLPWTYDPMREYPDERPRQELYHIYRDLLVNQRVPWAEVNGDYGHRLLSAILAVTNIS